MRIAAIDVASRSHQVFVGGAFESVANSEQGIGRWLSRQPSNTILVMEASGGYGLLLAQMAHARGHQVHVLPPRQIAAFRKSVGFRAKTDRKDAELIHEFARLHLDRLHLFKPLDEPWRTLKVLVRERYALARDRDRIKKRGVRFGYEELLACLDSHLAELDRRIQTELAGLDKAQELLEIPGVGPQLAALALATFAGTSFVHKDAFVAYAGLDLAVKESGQFKGRRYLTCRGDKVLRCLLYLAGFAASRSRAYRDQYAQLKIERKLKPTQAQIVLARKIARRIYGVLKT